VNTLDDNLARLRSIVSQRVAATQAPLVDQTTGGPLPPAELPSPVWTDTLSPTHPKEPKLEEAGFFSWLKACVGWRRAADDY
jgi:hypothetical protein